jgi:hypothetical protein
MITKSISFNLTRIYIDGILHVAFEHHKVLAFQSWKSTGVYSIELTFIGGSTILEYDTMEKWSIIIGFIDESLGRILEKNQTTK